MKAEHTDLPGVLILHPKVHQDDRGFFLERYHRRRYARLPGLDLDFVQDNHSRSKRGVLRGLHFQERHPQGKLVSVLAGRVWDVAVDINAQSPTFRRWVGVQLSAENHRQFYIPPGYAHGFCVLSEQADLLYKCTDFHHADDERGLLWSDPDLAIDWPVREPILSPRDAANPICRATCATAEVRLPVRVEARPIHRQVCAGRNRPDQAANGWRCANPQPRALCRCSCLLARARAPLGGCRPQ